MFLTNDLIFSPGEVNTVDYHGSSATPVGRQWVICTRHQDDEEWAQVNTDGTDATDFSGPWNRVVLTSDGTIFQTWQRKHRGLVDFGAGAPFSPQITQADLILVRIRGSFPKWHRIHTSYVATGTDVVMGGVGLHCSHFPCNTATDSPDVDRSGIHYGSNTTIDYFAQPPVAGGLYWDPVVDPSDPYYTYENTYNLYVYLDSPGSGAPASDALFGTNDSGGSIYLTRSNDELVLCAVGDLGVGADHGTATADYVQTWNNTTVPTYTPAFISGGLRLGPHLAWIFDTIMPGVRYMRSTPFESRHLRCNHLHAEAAEPPVISGRVSMPPSTRPSPSSSGAIRGRGQGLGARRSRSGALQPKRTVRVGRR